MYLFLVPLSIGFIFNSASAFTTYYSRHLGEQRGRLVCVILRDVLGIPLWAIGYAMAVREPSILLFTPVFITSMMAWLFLLTGGVVIIVGLTAIRWRAVAPSLQDTLVTHGIYAYIRHPLHSGMILELIGLFLFIPSVTVLAACILGWIWVIVQSRLEEIELVKRMPAYKDYMQLVPRYVPRIRS